ncbi:MAG: hypothetical protein NUV80_01455 [Candidatus Berkelbacteria bacterium]|nr:hypothetical protein [Candidatus Berkelbacteria bacterium]MCR4307208.1 hypothetical protein [Candidatus Berkelbacteria bacterium]
MKKKTIVAPQPEGLLQVSLPKRASDLPSYDKVPGVPHTFRGRPDYPQYEKQERFDRSVFRALVVGGFEESLCPHGPEWVAVSIAGAVRYACQRELLDPCTCRLLAHDYELWFGVWQLVWDALKNEDCPISPKVHVSLWRLMIATSDGGGDRGEPASYACKAADLWRDGYYFSGAVRSFDTLSLRAYSDGPGLDQFEQDDRHSLEVLVEGMKLMRQLLEERIRPIYSW